jgi:hypothetical protein
MSRCKLGTYSLRDSAIKRLRLDFQQKDWDGTGLFEIYDAVKPKILDSIRSDLLIQSLPDLLPKLPKLATFEVYLPGWRSEYHGYGDGHAPQLNLWRLGSLTRCLSNGLRTSTFEHLEDLRLSLTCTNEFSELSKALPDALLSRLGHLFLQITDARGLGGSRDYLIWVNEDDDGDDGFPKPNLQTIYPNAKHSSSTFSIAARCANLESFWIFSTHFLDADQLDWSPTSSGLKFLFLKRVRISAENLVQLLSPNKHSSIASSPLAKVWLEESRCRRGPGLKYSSIYIIVHRLSTSILSILPTVEVEHLLSIGGIGTARVRITRIFTRRTKPMKILCANSGGRWGNCLTRGSPFRSDSQTFSKILITNLIAPYLIA